MKTLVLTLTLLCSLNVHAVSWKVYGACDDKPLYQGEVRANLQESVGDLSVKLFEANGIPYVGAAEGFNSIAGTMTGLDAIEVVSDTELRAYGWCYTVNGQIPDQMPHEVKFAQQDARLDWFYAYSTNKNGEWMNDYCTPAYKIRAAQFCAAK